MGVSWGKKVVGFSVSVNFSNALLARSLNYFSGCKSVIG